MAGDLATHAEAPASSAPDPARDPAPDPGPDSAPHPRAIGIDVGGTGVKAAVVDLVTGEMVSPRIRERTPQPATPEAVIDAVGRIVDRLGEGGHLDAAMPAGAGLPGVVKHGRLLDRRQHRPELGRTSRPRTPSRSAWDARSASSTTPTPPASRRSPSGPRRACRAPCCC